MGIDFKKVRVLSNLISNLQFNLMRTLEDLASFERQEKYKKAVPFVHIPIELNEQLAQFTERGVDTSWYIHVVPTSKHKSALLELDGLIAVHFEMYDLDVPEVFETDTWQSVSRHATQCLNLFLVSVKK